MVIARQTPPEIVNSKPSSTARWVLSGRRRHFIRRNTVRNITGDFRVFVDLKSTKFGYFRVFVDLKSTKFGNISDGISYICEVID